MIAVILIVSLFIVCGCLLYLMFESLSEVDEEVSDHDWKDNG